MRFLISFVVLFSGVAFAQDAAAPKPATETESASKAEEKAPAAKKDAHAHTGCSGHGHAGHGHAKKASAGHAHAGKKTLLGTVTAGEISLEVTQIGEVHPGKEAIYSIRVKGEGMEAIRVWYGLKSAKGALKAKANKTSEADVFDVHLMHPKVSPKGAQLWFEVEDEDGEVLRVTVVSSAKSGS